MKVFKLYGSSTTNLKNKYLLTQRVISKYLYFEAKPGRMKILLRCQSHNYYFTVLVPIYWNIHLPLSILHAIVNFSRVIHKCILKYPHRICTAYILQPPSTPIKNFCTLYRDILINRDTPMKEPPAVAAVSITQLLIIL